MFFANPLGNQITATSLMNGSEAAGGSGPSPFGQPLGSPTEAARMSQAGAPSTRLKQYVLPVTLKSIVTGEKTPEGFKIFGVKAAMVTFVAQIVKVEKKELQYTFTFDDTTAKLDGKHILDGTDAEASRAMQRMVAGSYVRIIGPPKKSSKDGYIFVQCLQLHPVEDPNDVAFHQIEVGHTALKLLRGSVRRLPTPSQGSLLPPVSTQTAVTLTAPTAVPEPSGDVTMTDATAPTPAAPAPAPAVEKADLLTMIKTAVAAKGEQGAKFEHVVAAIGGAYSKEEIEKLWSSLIDDCEMFETIDGHYGF
ncbi:unnamed protein product [Amoebophrya sp. A25]|nr:unnamed protein product [Amoebophrya sp. A25]|eukprot:GSA25T00000712001.1